MSCDRDQGGRRTVEVVSEGRWDAVHSGPVRGQRRAENDTIARGVRDDLCRAAEVEVRQVPAGLASEID
jgi:hypothetical protein